MDDIAALLAAARALGKDRSMATPGGGNVSVKSLGVLHVKASGADLAALQASQLASFDLEALRRLYSPRRAALSASPRGSIETLLHALLPQKFILHSHADATAALSCNPSPARHAVRCWKGRVLSLPYQKPGKGLALAAAGAYQAALRRGERPLGIMLEKHGLVSWGDSAAGALKLHFSLVKAAKAYVKLGNLEPRKGSPAFGPRPLHAPEIRGLLGHKILALDGSPWARAFSLRKDAKRLCEGGPSTPDHLLYCKPRILFADTKKLPKAAKQFEASYRAYFKKHAPQGAQISDPSPSLLVLKGYGVVASGATARAAELALEIFRHTALSRIAAQKLGGYRGLKDAEACEFEYWPAETSKLPAAKGELEGKIALVTGAARGIGKACALRLAEAGACVALLDLDSKALSEVSSALGERGLALRCDISDPASVSRAFQGVEARWGGLDILVNNAGLARCAPVEAMKLEDWDQSFAVNARGHLLCAREAARIFRRQGLGGAMAFVSSKNVLAPGKDFAAYSTSKAAQTQLAKVLALELAPIGVRVNCVTPDGVFDDSRLWDGIRESRAKAHGIKASELEGFYVARNLLKRKVLPQDVAEAVLFLVSERSSKTTGCLFPVDGGVKEAFPR